MKIRQILNNNIALVQRGEIDVIVLSSGISFKKKIGDSLSIDEVEKVFVPDSNDVLENYSYLLSNADDSALSATLRIINYVESNNDDKVNAYLYLTLLDHIDFALKRAQKGQFIVSPLAWEVKRFYPKEYAVGIQALAIIAEESGVNFPESEAVSIALHLVNLHETKMDLNEIMRIIATVGDMLTIIQHHFKTKFDENSMDYNRMITHLQYFAQRLCTGKTFGSEDADLNDQVRSLYPESYMCVNKIGDYVKEQFGKKLTIDEETYLILHIHRVTLMREEQ